MHKPRHGFSLVELIFVLVILGLFIAVALPRFYNLEADARAAKVDGILSVVSNASSHVHASTKSLGARSQAASAIEYIEGKMLELAHGYPAATPAGIVRAAEVEKQWDHVTISIPSPGKVVFDVQGGTPGKCGVIYTQARAANAPPRITANRSAC